MEELIPEKMVWDQPSGHNRKNAKAGKRGFSLKAELLPGIFIFAAALVIGAMLALHGAGRLVHREIPRANLLLQGISNGKKMPAEPRIVDGQARISLGMQIGNAVGAEYRLIVHFRENTFFLDTNSENGVHLLILSKETGCRGYWSAKPFLVPWGKADRSRIEQALTAFGISVPAAAHFLSDSNGWHTFTVNSHREGDLLTIGTLRCRYASDGTIRELKNDLISYTVSLEG